MLITFLEGMVDRKLIKIFISYKGNDEEWAERIAWHLKTKNVDIYLDKLDPYLDRAGDDIGEYFRKQISECTHLMAVVSENTKNSWWVPFEIGIATEKQYPISTFAIEYTVLPQYLKKWPYLRLFPEDLDTYIRIATKTYPKILDEGLQKIASDRRSLYSKRFHIELKRALGQYYSDIDSSIYKVK